MKKVTVILFACCLSCFLASCTTCNCDLAKKQCEEAKKILTSSKSSQKELKAVEEKLRKLELRCEAALTSASYSAERADTARRECENILIRLQALEREKESGAEKPAPPQGFFKLHTRRKMP